MRRGPAKSFTLSENKHCNKIINEVLKVASNCENVNKEHIIMITLNGKSLKIAHS